MSKAAAVKFITEINKAHGVHEAIREEKRLVLCTEEGVGLTEYYLAHNSGMKPELKIKLTLEEDYHGETRLEYLGNPYDIIRTKPTDDGGLEIVAQRGDVNGQNQETDNDAG